VTDTVVTDEQAAAISSTHCWTEYSTTLMTLHHPENLQPKIPSWCSMEAGCNDVYKQTVHDRFSKANGAFAATEVVTNAAGAGVQLLVSRNLRLT
jgi:hypothetical protein